MFEPYLQQWNLAPDGKPILTRTSRLLPVTRDGQPAMLKIAIAHEECFGNIVLDWWDSNGAAPVLEQENAALLTVRARQDESLAVWARSGRDDEACLILCDVIKRLHTNDKDPPHGATPLDFWFRALEPAAQTYGGVLARCACVAGDLLAEEREPILLHGDIHHGNVLDFGPLGWLAIDPKGLLGARVRLCKYLLQSRSCDRHRSGDIPQACCRGVRGRGDGVHAAAAMDHGLVRRVCKLDAG